MFAQNLFQMKNKFILSILILLVSNFWSCKKDNDSKPTTSTVTITQTDLTQANRSWQLTAATISPSIKLDDSEVTDLYKDFYDACAKDNFITFFSDGKFEKSEGDDKCPKSSAVIQGSFTINTEKTKITVSQVDTTYTMEVVEFSTSQLKALVKVKLEDDDETVKDYTITFTFKSIETPLPSTPAFIDASTSDITQTGFKISAEIRNQGKSPITARGFVWSTSANPTVSLTTKSNNGAGIGTFSNEITALQSNRTYYVRAYVTNLEGTFYGNQVTVKTLPVPLSSLGLALVDKDWAWTGYFENGVDQTSSVSSDCEFGNIIRFTSDYRYTNRDIGTRCLGGPLVETGSWSLNGTNFGFEGSFTNFSISGNTMSYEESGFPVSKYVYTLQ